MPGMCGADLAAWVADNCPQVMRIMLTGHADLKTAILAINDLGVCRFFTKPCNEARLAVAIHKAIEQKDAQGAHREAFERGGGNFANWSCAIRGLNSKCACAADDLHGPLQTLVDCCRRLQERSEGCPDLEARRLLTDAGNAASGVLRTCRPAKDHRLL